MPKNNDAIVRAFFDLLVALIPPEKSEPDYDRRRKEITDHVEIGNKKLVEFDTYIALKENYYQCVAYVQKLNNIIPPSMRACALRSFMRWNANTRDVYFAIEGEGDDTWLVLRYTFERNGDTEVDVDRYLALRGVFGMTISQKLSALIERIKRECDDGD